MWIPISQSTTATLNDVKGERERESIVGTDIAGSLATVEEMKRSRERERESTFIIGRIVLLLLPCKDMTMDKNTHFMWIPISQSTDATLNDVEGEKESIVGTDIAGSLATVEEMKRSRERARLLLGELCSSYYLVRI